MHAHPLYKEKIKLQLRRSFLFQYQPCGVNPDQCDPHDNQRDEKHFRSLRQRAGGAGFRAGDRDLVKVLKGGGIFIKLLDECVIHGFLAAYGAGHIFHQLTGSFPDGGGAGENRRDEAVVNVGEEQLCRLDLYAVMQAAVGTLGGEVLLILGRLLRLRGDGDVTLRL